MPAAVLGLGCLWLLIPLMLYYVCFRDPAGRARVSVGLGLRRGSVGGLYAVPLSVSCCISSSCVAGIHQDEESHAEETPDQTRILQAIRHRVHPPRDPDPDPDSTTPEPPRPAAPAPHHALYEVRLRASSAGPDLEGVYQCGIERQQDKLYVIAAVTLRGHLSPFPSRPKADLASCEGTNYDALNEHVSLTAGRPTCLRCRGYGFPRPQVGLYNHRDEEVFIPRGQGAVTKYVNVADAGVAEATYTWLRPEASFPLSGRDFYTCRAANDLAAAAVRFRVLLR